MSFEIATLQLCSDTTYTDRVNHSCKSSDLVYVFKGAYNSHFDILKNHESLVVNGYLNNQFIDICFDASWYNNKRQVICSISNTLQKIAREVSENKSIQECLKIRGVFTKLTRKLYTAILKILNNSISRCFYLGIPSYYIDDTSLDTNEIDLRNRYRDIVAAGSTINKTLPLNWKNYFYTIEAIEKRYNLSTLKKTSILELAKLSTASMTLSNSSNKDLINKLIKLEETTPGTIKNLRIQLQKRYRVKKASSIRRKIYFENSMYRSNFAEFSQQDLLAFIFNI